MKSISGTIFELRVSFRGSDAGLIKAQSIQWLQTRGIDGIVESVIDGVDTPLPDGEQSNIEFFVMSQRNMFVHFFTTSDFQ